MYALDDFFRNRPSDIRAAIASHQLWLDGRGGSRADFAGANLTGADFRDTNLAYASFAGAVLAQSRCNRGNFSGATFRGCNLVGMDAASATFSGADLSECEMFEISFFNSDCVGASFARSNLSRANLADANLARANFSDAVLYDVFWPEARLHGASLQNATLPAGYSYEAYLADVVPMLCTAGGVSLAEVARAWDEPRSPRGPMEIAFGCERLRDVPLLYRQHALDFVQLYDAGLIPRPAPLQIP